MSASANANATRGFVEANVRKLPTLACIGRVAYVGDGKVSESGNYVVQPIDLHGLGAAPASTRYNLLYRPEWFVAGFDPNGLESSDEGKKMLSVYRRNIAARKKVSALKGMAGSEEGFLALANALLSADLDPASESIVEEVQQILTDFFAENTDTEIGYILTQKRDKTDETDAQGRTVYELADGYEVREFFIITPEALKSYRKRAQKDPEKFRVAFDDETPF